MIVPGAAGVVMLGGDKLLTISLNRMNLHLATVYTGVFGSMPASGFRLRVVIASGVFIYSTDTSLPALRSGAFPAGTQITLVNNGYILGKGGRGGHWNSSGLPGGTAIELDGVSYLIDNSGGYILGGGGGGGGGFVTLISGNSGGGGGGGAGGAAGGNSTAGVNGAGDFPFATALGDNVFAGLFGNSGDTAGSTYQVDGTGSAVTHGASGGVVPGTVVSPGLPFNYTGTPLIVGDEGGGGGGGYVSVGGAGGAQGTLPATPPGSYAGGGGGGFGQAGGAGRYAGGGYGGGGFAGGAAGKAINLGGGSATFLGGNTSDRVRGAVS